MNEDYVNLHQIPELGFQEFKTQTYLKHRLEKMRCQIHCLDPTGIIAFFNFNQSKTIAFRAEMDGLPIIEQTNLAYKSRNGFMHACGHDAHMSMLLALCDYLNSTNASVNVVAIFQPSEESYGGSLKVLENDYFQSLNIEEVYALHLWPTLPQGKLFTKELLFPAAIEIDINIIGKQSHISGNGINAIDIATVLLKEIPIQEDSYFNCGRMIAEGKRNIKCDKVQLECSYRTYQNPVEFIKNLILITKRIEKDYQCEIKCQYRIIPTLKNDLSLLRNLDVKLISNTYYQAEDFAFYSQSYRTLFVLLGCGDTELHSNKFCFEIDILNHGLSFYQKVINSFTEV